MNEIKFGVLMAFINRTFAHVSATKHYNWSAEFGLDDSTKNLKQMEDTILKDYDITECNQKQLNMLGFINWDDSGLVLIPLHLMKAIKQDFEVTDIGGKKFKLSEADNDIRFGCISSGWIPAK